MAGISSGTPLEEIYFPLSQQTSITWLGVGPRDHITLSELVPLSGLDFCRDFFFLFFSPTCLFCLGVVFLFRFIFFERKTKLKLGEKGGEEDLGGTGRGENNQILC